MSAKYRLNPNISKVTVVAKSTLHDVKATCPRLEGDLFGDINNLTKTGGGTLKLDVRGFTSGDRIRDFAVRSHVDTARHPEAELIGLKILSAEGEPKDMKILWEGTLRYRFKTPKIQGEARVRQEGGRIAVEASFPLVLKDINLEAPKILFLKVEETVKIEVKLEANQL
jgi:hypothetical protein